MLVFSNVSQGSQNSSTTYTNNVPTYTAGALSVWCCTARDLGTMGNSPNSIIEKNARTSDNCFMRGLKERVQIGTNDGLPWSWRRIVFASKNPDFRTSTAAPNSGNTINFRVAAETNNGWARVVNQPVIGGAFDDVIWKGQQNVDWKSFITAPVDTTRVDLMYDRTRQINPGNAQGMNKTYTMWHPMNKTLHYDGDEGGATVAVNSSFSVLDKRGMGDVYVIDVFQPGPGRIIGGSSYLTFEPEATLYWHER